MKVHPEAKVLSISHNDLDGVGAQIVLGAIFKNIQYINVSYKEIDDALVNLDETKYDFIFVTDISPSVKELLYRFDNLMLIDHHQNLENDPSHNIHINHKYSGTYLTWKYLIHKYGDSVLGRYEKLVTLINDYDMWILKYKASKALNDLYTNYHADKFRRRFRSGKLKLKESEKEYLQRIEDSFNKKYNELEIFDFDNINACYFLSDSLVNELSHKLLHDKGYDFVFFNTMYSYKLSIRHKIPDFNMGAILKELGWGGGHKQACGIDGSTAEELNDNLNKIEELLYDKLPEIRKN